MKDVKKAILMTCKRLIDENGVDSISVRKLVEASGCSLRSLYNKFDNLQAVYHAVMDEITIDIRDFIQAALPEIPLNNDQLFNAYSAFIQYLLEHPNHFHFLYLYKHDRIEGQEPLFASNDFQDQLRQSFTYLVDEYGLSYEEVALLNQRILYGIFGLLTLYFTGNFNLTREMVIPAFKDFYDRQMSCAKSNP